MAERNDGGEADRNPVITKLLKSPQKWSLYLLIELSTLRKWSKCTPLWRLQGHFRLKKKQMSLLLGIFVTPYIYIVRVILWH